MSGGLYCCLLRAADPEVARHTAHCCSCGVSPWVQGGPPPVQCLLSWGGGARFSHPDRASHLCAVDGMGPQGPCPSRVLDTTETVPGHDRDVLAFLGHVSDTTRNTFRRALKNTFRRSLAHTFRRFYRLPWNVGRKGLTIRSYYNDISRPSAAPIGD